MVIPSKHGEFSIKFRILENMAVKIEVDIDIDI